jgi:hypothetical protein
MTLFLHHTVIAIGLVLLIAGCGDDASDENDASECDPNGQDCEEGMVCEESIGETMRCAAPVFIKGEVLDFSDETTIEGAMIQAVNPNMSPVGTSDVSAEDGTFTLQVPAVRDEDGVPIQGAYTLRAQASGYQIFPSGFRQSLPLDVSDAQESDEGWVLQNTISTVELISLPESSATLGAITGKIVSDTCAGILVVAENESGALPGYSDAECNYTIFNVPPGTYTVSGYAADLQLDSADATVSGSDIVDGVVLNSADSPLNTISGNVQIVNAPGDSVTSVVLAVESTFEESIAKGEVPPGLRVGDVTGEFTIAGVPNGRYVVLAAFENDDLVRDPDQSIGGTQIVHIEVPDSSAGNQLTISEGFKITEALAVISPGADGPERISTATPTLEWADDSSEDGYEVAVFNAFGEEVWKDEVVSVSGNKTVTLQYGGPSLEPGMYYQFRVISFKDTKDGRTYISATEDLKGVFFYFP